METSQLRLCFIEVLKGIGSNGITQFGGHLFQEIAWTAGHKGFIPKQERQSAALDRGDQNKVRELFWAFIIQGILIPGYDSSNTNLPFFTITEYGTQVISTNDPVPHDPDRYLEHLRSQAPLLDAVALSFVGEGLDCFQRGTYRASIVMLGVASEKLTLDLAGLVQSALSGTNASKLLEFIQNGKISTIHEEMMKRLEPKVSTLPKGIADGLDHHLGGIFTTIRIYRNQAGHPTNSSIDRLTALGLFSSFPAYCKRASDLMAHIQANGLP